MNNPCPECQCWHAAQRYKSVQAQTNRVICSEAAEREIDAANMRMDEAWAEYNAQRMACPFFATKRDKHY